MTDPTPPTQPDPPTPDEAPTEALPAGDRPRRLLRSRDDRMLAGVAGGLGEYFTVDPLIVRIGFAVSVFFGGLGILAYLALALFVPSQPEVPGGEPTQAPVHRRRWLGIAAAGALVIAVVSAAGSLFFWADPWPWDGGGWGLGWLLVVVAIGVAVYSAFNRRDGAEGKDSGRSDLGRVVSIAALSLAAVFGLGLIAIVSAWVAAVGSGAVIAGVVAAIGALLLVAAFYGGARWLIAPALALAVPLAIVSAADVSFAGGVGEREYRPATERAIPEEGYELGVGRLEVDLRGIDWAAERIVGLDADLGVGEALIVVPENVCVEAELEAGVGEVQAGGESSDGFEAAASVSPGTTAAPRLEFDGDVDLGALRVIADDDLDLDDHRWDHHDRGGDDEARAIAEAACER